MSDSIEYQYQLISEYSQPSPRQTICQDCAFHTKREDGIDCIHPDELQVNCSTIIFCNSFQPAQEIDSPCVSFDYAKK
ncbi:hypothetical protein NIES2100_33420 [Calothrix sp. NIES-2100]|uniref:hypothetical protein n=1 Tax=Calothrix sp. NIES-2100 TaxID=1954172 RepID=UPI000B60DEB4|nr:hypothetical protein NIES2100_33420 [Calothrix sp. NIES-2100]